MAPKLEGKVALVAGEPAGRGIAVELGAARATIYVTGRSTRGHRSEYDRTETIEETADLMDGAGGRGIAVRVDHLVPDLVRASTADRFRAVGSPRSAASWTSTAPGPTPGATSPRTRTPEGPQAPQEGTDDARRAVDQSRTA
jgi:NAD(P)-dependent dehydrogenase (short-subunit alcohol dehydrogenase family)